MLGINISISFCLRRCEPSMSEQYNTNATILIVDDNESARTLMSQVLEQVGYVVYTAIDGQDAIEKLDNIAPHLILTDVNMPNMNGMELLKIVRQRPDTIATPVILLTAQGTDDYIITGLDLGADDYLVKPVDIAILQARIRAKLKRPPVPLTELARNYRTNLMTFPSFMVELERELVRIHRWKSSGHLAAIGFYELDAVYHRLGDVMDALVKQVNVLMGFDALPIELLCEDGAGHVLILIPESSKQVVHQRLARLAKRIMRNEFILQSEQVHITPTIGYVALADNVTAPNQYSRAMRALQLSTNQLDLYPKFYAGGPEKHQETKDNATRWRKYLAQYGRSATQILLTFAIGWVIPFLIYAVVGSAGYNLAHVVYVGVVLALLFTSALIWIEGYLSLHQNDLPTVNGDYPPASIIIPAYLPNEAGTILSTLDACFRLDYPAPLQIILAYNTPHPMLIEQTLQRLEKEHSNFVARRVEQSTSKAQNVNAALSYITGEFVGIYDADHHPAEGCLRRAWAWLSNGYDVVQGHCLIRNGAVNFIAQMVAVEFEAIYALSHPGRAQLHDFGIFGGSNGYWKTELLREIRMQGFMLTEDIDSSLRALHAGYRIKSDRDIISRELAPTTAKALWSQRMRWAQGWYQVTLRHTMLSLVNRQLTLRQKFGLFHLLIWREIYPWIAMQIIPIVLYWAWSQGGFDKVEWFVPIFVVTTIITLGTGPGQVYYLMKVGHPSIMQNRRWVLQYLLFAPFYSEYKNLIGRVAQLKEIMGERIWRTTPRT